MQLSPRTTLLTTVLIAAGIALPAGAGDDAAPPTPRNDFAELPGLREFSGRMIVRPVQLTAWIGAGMPTAAAGALVASAHELARQSEVLRYVPETDEFIIELTEGETENGVSRDLMATGLFQYAEPDWIVYPVGTPNDPGFGNQWHHNANRMDSADGWDIHTGNPAAAVAICDTGVRTTHNDLQLHRLEGYNAVNQKWESNGGNIGPVHAHGTMCTGCAAANGNNGIGIAGVGWDLSHRMIRVTNDSSGGAYLSDIQHGARTAIEAGDRAASVSYSGPDTSSNLTTATYIKSIGGLLIWAAGNDGRNLTYGNRDADDMIVVGATNSSDTKPSWSAYGNFVDLTAPGDGIYTTDSGHDNDYATVSGTSFSTPLTAGLVGLIWSYNPSLTPDEVESALKAGCDDLGAGGVDNTYGYGRIDTFGALSLIVPSCSDPVNYCSTAPNSVGSGALITWTGTASASADDFHLVATDAPPDQFLMFYYGAGETEIPFGNGWRCVNAGGVGLYRFKPFKADMFGFAVMKVDWSQPPVGGGGFGDWLTGDIWKCQGWYRDPAGGGSQFNLTDALSIEICP